MTEPVNFTEDTDLRNVILNILEAKLELIKKENLSTLGVNIQTGRLKIEL